MTWVEVEFRGRQLRVPALKHRGRLWFHWEGRTHVVDLNADKRHAGGSAEAADPTKVIAPMPGKVTRVEVQKGDAVTKGQSLVVMEAMKMEYTLEAGCDGRVQELNAEAGRQVALGDVLVRLESALETHESR